MTDGNHLLTPPEAAKMVKFKVGTLAVWRCDGEGPAYLKIKRSVRYRFSDVQQWIDATLEERQEIISTADCHAAAREKTKRPKGRTAVDDRARRLQEERHCRDCRDKGLSVLAEEVDHIVALTDGGSNEDENIRCLCKPCHQARTEARFAKKPLFSRWNRM